MKDDTERPEAGQQYAAAYATHYDTKDLREALVLYGRIMTVHPDTPEAGYSRSQIKNIVRAVIPAKELFDAQMSWAVAHFDHQVLRNKHRSAEMRRGIRSHHTRRSAGWLGIARLDRLESPGRRRHQRRRASDRPTR